MLVEIVRAQGIYMYGPDGKRYTDLISGVSVSNTGHSHPKVVKAVKDQVDAYMHLMVYGEIIQSPQVKYAEHLAALLPESLNSCYFVNSGSEAVEGGLKLAKRYTGRSRIISFRNSFRPLLPDTWQIDFNDSEALSAIDSKTACVIIEPVQGEAGVRYPENGFLQKLRERCSETGSLLIFDEIQTAFGRTGSMFAIDKFGVVPDILLLAKALGGGMPLGAFISSNEIMSSLITNPPLGHITTFGGHPVCCAAGMAALEVIIEEKLVEKCSSRSDIFKWELNHQLIVNVRGEGLLLAVELPDPEYVHYVIAHAPEFGLILDYFLFCNNAFRIAPPLIISEEEIVAACAELKLLLNDAMLNTHMK
jgi:acetylornithine/succinyldiaminopimelate/putrescine aminotransferase